DNHGIRVAGPCSGVADGNMIENSEECDKGGDDINNGSDASDLLSLADIFARGGTGLEGVMTSAGSKPSRPLQRASDKAKTLWGALANALQGMLTTTRQKAPPSRA